MNEAEIILGILAIALVATDIAVRLAIAPHRRDEQLGELISSLMEASPDSQLEPEQKAAAKPMIKYRPLRLLIRRKGSL